MIEQTHDDAGLDVEASVAAGKLAHVLSALLASMRLDAIGGPMAREANRVAGILARDAEDAAAERARDAAVIELAEGLTVNLVDTVVPPTPEWLAKGESRTVMVGSENWTDRGAHDPVRTVRRIRVSHVYKMHMGGRLTQREYKACAWYRDKYEAAGLEGHAKTSSFEPKIAATVTSNLPFSTAQLEAQDDLDNARLVFPRRLRKFFEAVVIDDLSMKAAAKVAQAGRHPLDNLRHCASRVADYVEYSTGKPI